MSGSSGNGSSAKAKPHTERPATVTTSQESTSIFDPKIARELWLSQLSDFMDRYLRSPVFLAWLHCYLTLDNLRLVWFRRPAVQPSVTPTPIHQRGDEIR